MPTSFAPSSFPFVDRFRKAVMDANHITFNGEPVSKYEFVFDNSRQCFWLPEQVYFHNSKLPIVMKYDEFKFEVFGRYVIFNVYTSEGKKRASFQFHKTEPIIP